MELKIVSKHGIRNETAIQTKSQNKLKINLPVDFNVIFIYNFIGYTHVHIIKNDTRIMKLMKTLTYFSFLQTATFCCIEYGMLCFQLFSPLCGAQLNRLIDDLRSMTQK